MTDDLKPINCGCGGEAKVQRVRTLESHLIVVMCTKCEIATNYYTNEAEAVEAWNWAMGVKDINVPNKFVTDTNVGGKTAKFKQDGEFLICGKCNHIVDSGYKYCPECGSRLEWNE